MVTSVQYGLSRRDRTKEKSAGYFMTLNAFHDLVAVPDQYYLGSVNLDFIGMGDMIAYNSVAMVRDGFYDLTLEESSYATNQWTVDETVTTAFAMAILRRKLRVKKLGNIGFIETDQSSRAFARRRQPDSPDGSSRVQQLPAQLEPAHGFG